MNAPAPREWLLAALFGLLLLGLLLPWPRPSVALADVCELTEAGRFAVQCDLEAAAARSGRDWLRRGLRVYERGLLLREADRPADVRRENPGSFHTSGRVLTLASLDRSDPRTNGHAYRIRPASREPSFLRLSESPRRLIAAGLVVFAFAGICLVWALRARRGLAPAWAGAIVFAGVGLAVQITAVLSQAPVNVDAGDVLPAAEAIARGAVPYRSLLYNLYTPLGAYEFALWGRLWPGPPPPPYPWYLGLVLLNEAACAGLVFVILRRAAVSARLAALTSLSLFGMTLWFDGGRVLHEPLFLVPVLVAALLALGPPKPASDWLSGALAALAFMIKQYGGFGLAGALGAALAADGRRLRAALRILAGFAAGLLAIGLLLVGLGADWRAFVAQAVAPKYAARYESVWLKLFLWQCPLVLPALAVPFLLWSRPAVRVAACFGLASCLPLLIRQQQYYFLNLCPWLFLLFALGTQALAEQSPRWRVPAQAFAMALLLGIPLRAAAAQAVLIEQETRAPQLRRAWQMNQAVSPERPALLLLYPGFVHLTHSRSADEAQLGYRFANEHPAERLRAGFASAEGVWIDPRGMYARGADQTLREAGSSLADQLQQHGFTRKLVLEDRFELWTKAP